MEAVDRVAASVRADLADTISQMDGSPSARQITAWLAQLTDEEVLDRMARLKATHTSEVLRHLQHQVLDAGRIVGRPCRRDL